jgi:hypothetical protein
MKKDHDRAPLDALQRVLNIHKAGINAHENREKLKDISVSDS